MPLNNTLLVLETPKTVCLPIVSKNWALLEVLIKHEPGEPTAGVGVVYVRKLDEHELHWLANNLFVHWLQAEWQNYIGIQPVAN